MLFILVFGGEGPFTLGGVTVQLGGGSRTIGYRYVESILPIDAPVYVIGTVRKDGHIGTPSDGEGGKRFLISHRSEEQLERKYKRTALLLGGLAVGLFLFGSFFLVIGVLVGIATMGSTAAIVPSLVTLS